MLLLRLLIACALLGSLAAKPAFATDYHVLSIYCSGGWDPAMVFDNKLKSPYVSTESGATSGSGGGGIPYVTNSDRPLTSLFFQDFGSEAVIVNGVFVGSMDHRAAQGLLFSNIPVGKNRAVDWLTYYAATANPSDPLGHVNINAPFIPGEYSASAVHLNAQLITDYTTAVTSPLGSSGEAALMAFRQIAMSNFTGTAGTGSLDLEKATALSNAFNHEPLLTTQLTTAVTTVGSDSADDTFAHNGKIAIELFVQGATHAVSLQAGNADAWDTTTDNFALQTTNYEAFFADLHTLLTYAQTRGVASTLIVVVMSEMGRAPKLNAQGGKGPWPYTSVLAWGPIFKGGTAVGVSDVALRGQAIDPVFGGTSGATAVTITPANIWAAIYLKLGMDLKAVLPNTPPFTYMMKGS